MSTPTANYGWAKPTVGADGDAWGGELNTSLDGIDSTVKSVSNAIPVASSTTPVMNGTAAVGTGTTWARADHVHPTDTSLYSASNPAGYQTAAQVTAAIPVASSTPPIMDGVAAVGTGTTWARADHSHPTDTSRYAASNPSGYQTAANVTASLAPYAPLASPAFTGTPSMPTGTTGVTQTAGNNSTALATTAYVDARPVAMNDNRIINGDMRIDQRNNGAVGTALNSYTIDRWFYGSSQASKINWQRAAPGPPGFGYCFSFTSTSAYTALATDNFNVSQAIEADAFGDTMWGTASAQPVTLSFWAYSTQGGTFGGSLCSSASPFRSYVFTFTLPSATWTKRAITIPGDTGGTTWTLSGNSVGAYVRFDLGSGANYLTAAGSWQTGNYIGATGEVSVVSTNNAALLLTGVKLEIGSVATPFNRESLAKCLADCQRYYQTGVFDFNAYGAAGQAISTFNSFQSMRAVPSIAYSGISYSNCSGATAADVQINSLKTYVVVTATGGLSATGNFTASAEL